MTYYRTAFMAEPSEIRLQPTLASGDVPPVRLPQSSFVSVEFRSIQLMKLFASKSEE